MAAYCVHVDRFSAGLDELTRRQQRDPREVLRCLDRIGRFSVFEATENQSIAKTMDYLGKSGYIKTTPRGFPWSDVELTKQGRSLLESKGNVMRERGLILDHCDVRATRSGAKTQHRIPVKFHPTFPRHESWKACYTTTDGGYVFLATPDPGKVGRFLKDPGKRCPLGEVGDRLWVRETYVGVLAVSPASDQPLEWGERPFLRVEEPTRRPNGDWHYDGLDVIWRADGECEFCDGDGFSKGSDFVDPADCPRWRSPATMPRKYSRLLLEIAKISVERAHDVAVRDLVALGLPQEHCDTTGLVNCATAVQWWQNRWDARQRRPGDRWRHNPWQWVVDWKVISS